MSKIRYVSPNGNIEFIDDTKESRELFKKNILKLCFDSGIKPEDLNDYYNTHIIEYIVDIAYRIDSMIDDYIDYFKVMNYSSEKISEFCRNTAIEFHEKTLFGNEINFDEFIEEKIINEFKFKKD